MEIVANGDNLHETSNPVFREKKKKCDQFVICLISPESVKD